MKLKKSIKYKILASEKLVLEYYSGYISKEDIYRVKKKISALKDYRPTFHLIADFTSATLAVDVKEVPQYFTFIRNNPKLMGKRKTAFITSKPNEVVLSHIFDLSKKDTPIESNIFSSFSAAASLLNLSSTAFNQVNEIIEDFRK